MDAARFLWHTLSQSRTLASRIAAERERDQAQAALRESGERLRLEDAALGAAANAIVGLDDEWEDVTGHEPELGYHFSTQCSEICYVAEQVQAGAQFRLLKRRVPENR